MDAPVDVVVAKQPILSQVTTSDALETPFIRFTWEKKNIYTFSP